MGSVIHGASHKATRHFRKEPASLAVYWIYCSRTNNENVAWPGIRGLVRDTGWETEACTKGRHWLVEHKALEQIDNYIRPEWRELSAQQKSRFLNLDHAEYYRPTGYIEFNGKRYQLLYNGNLEISDLEEQDNDNQTSGFDVLPGGTSSFDVLPGGTSTPPNIHAAERNLIPEGELDSISSKDSLSPDSDDEKSSNPVSAGSHNQAPQQMSFFGDEIPVGQALVNGKVIVPAGSKPKKPPKKPKESKLPPMLPETRQQWYSVIQSTWSISSSDGQQDPKKQRAQASMTMLWLMMLLGVADKDGWAEYNLSVALTPDDLSEWASWWKGKNKGMNMLEQHIKVKSSIEYWYANVRTVNDAANAALAEQEEIRRLVNEHNRQQLEVIQRAQR